MLNHIKNDIALTIIHIIHCSMHRCTVKNIPIIDKHVVKPSIIGLFPPNIYMVKIVNEENNIDIQINKIRFFSVRKVFCISILSLFKCLFHWKKGTGTIRAFGRTIY